MNVPIAVIVIALAPRPTSGAERLQAGIDCLFVALGAPT